MPCCVKAGIQVRGATPSISMNCLDHKCVMTQVTFITTGMRGLSCAQHF